MLKIPRINIVAFDPGETTGIVEIENGELVKAYVMEYQQILDAVAFDMGNARHWKQHRVWVVEDYRTYPTTSIGFDAALSARLLGVLEVAALQVGAKVVYQLAGTVKHFMTNDKLKQFGWLVPNRHIRDAARHAAYYILCGAGPFGSLVVEHKKYR